MTAEPNPGADAVEVLGQLLRAPEPDWPQIADLAQRAMNIARAMAAATADPLAVPQLCLADSRPDTAMSEAEQEQRFAEALADVASELDRRLTTQLDPRDALAISTALQKVGRRIKILEAVIGVEKAKAMKLALDELVRIEHGLDISYLHVELRFVGRDGHEADPEADEWADKYEVED